MMAKTWFDECHGALRGLAIVLTLCLVPFTASAQDDAPEKPKGGDFSMEDFESASFNAEVKALQAKQAIKRRGLISKMEALLAREPYYPQRARVYFQLGESYYQVKKYEYLLSREEFENRLEEYEEGRLTVKPDEPLEDYSISLSYYRKILAEFPDYPRIDEVIYYLGRGSLKAGKENEDRQLTRQGVSNFQKLEQNYPRSRFIAESILALAEYHFESNSLYPAKVKYEKIITHFPNKGMVDYARYKLGWVYFNLGDFEDAINTFHTVVERVSTGTTRGMIEFKDQALNDLVVCYAEVDDGWKLAREYFIKIIGEKEAYVKLLKLAQLYVGQDRDIEAVELYSHFIEYNPRNPDIPEYFDNILAVVDKSTDFALREQKVREMIKFFDKRNVWYEANQNNTSRVNEAFTMMETRLLQLAQHYHDHAQKKNSEASYRQAAKDYAQFLELFPESKHAYIVNFYYAEILYDPMKEYEQAITQYTQVIKRNSKGEVVEDSALGIVFAYQELMKKAGVVEDTGGKLKAVKLSASEVKKRSKPIPRTELHELELGLIEAGDQYVKLITALLKSNPEVKKKHPERGEMIPEISFISAQTFYKHGQFKEAIKRLEQLFEYDPTHKYAAYAVNTMLDCYVRLRYWDEIEQWATRLIDAKNFKIKSKRDLNKIRAVARGEKARDRAALKDYKGAIKDYMSVFKEFRKDDPSIAANALHAVGVIYQEARRLPEAIKTYQKLANTFPDNDRAPEAMNEIGLIYESQTQFRKAATALEALVKKFPKYATAADSLRNAGLIREAIGDTKGAIKAFTTYVKQFKNRDDIAVVDHRIGKILQDAGGKKNLIKAAKHFTSFAKREARKGEGANPDLVIEALTRAGHITKGLGKEERRKSKRKSMLKSARKSYTDAVTAYAALPAPTPVAQHFAAESAFELVEFQYETFVAATLDMKSMKRLGKSIGAKADLMTGAEANYFKILEYKDSQVSAGALFRIGKLYLDFAETLLNAPMPSNIPIELEDQYIAALEEKAFPIKEKSLGAFLNALRTAQELKAYNKWSKLSADYASKLNPDEFPISSEPAAQPVHFKNTLASNNLIRSLRRGNIIVPMIELKDDKKATPAN